VFRRPNETPQINLAEIQCWVAGVNILPPNSTDLIDYFAVWETDKTFETSDTGSRNDTAPVSGLYNNVIELGFGGHSNQGSGAVIITNIPLTAIVDIQAIVLYNRQDSQEGQYVRIVNMFFELYNSKNDPYLYYTISNYSSYNRSRRIIRDISL
jgi:predicted NUDIX family phosphoesterase